MKLSESQKNRIKKLHALSKRGYKGEKENAQRFFEKALKKYDITFSEYLNLLKDEEIVYCQIDFSNEDEEKILCNTIFMLWPEWDGSAYCSAENTLTIKCSKATGIEIDLFFSVYRQDWVEHLEKNPFEFVDSFVIANKIYPEKMPFRNIGELNWHGREEQRLLHERAQAITPSKIRRRIK